MLHFLCWTSLKNMHNTRRLECHITEHKNICIVLYKKRFNRPQIGTEVFQGRKGSSGSSVAVSIGAHSHPGRRSWQKNVPSIHIFLFTPIVCISRYLDYIGHALCKDPGYWLPVVQSDDIHVKDKPSKANVVSIGKFGRACFTWLLAISKDLATYFNRLKLIEGILT